MSRPAGGDALAREGAVGLVADALARVLDIDPRVVRGDTPLAALGIDSLGLVCLADALDDAIAVRGGRPAWLADGDLAAARTVDDVARLLTAGAR